MPLLNLTEEYWGQVNDTYRTDIHSPMRQAMPLTLPVENSRYLQLCRLFSNNLNLLHVLCHIKNQCRKGININTNKYMFGFEYFKYCYKQNIILSIENTVCIWASGALTTSPFSVALFFDVNISYECLEWRMCLKECCSGMDSCRIQ